MRMLKKQQELNFKPGDQYMYSNTGYNLLALIVEKVSGMSFRDWIASNIFKPLAMNSSQVADNYKLVVKNLASSYVKDGENYNHVNDALTAYGSSSIYSSVDDLAKWVIFFQKGLASHDKVIARMLEDSKLNNGQNNIYGYGLKHNTINGVRTIIHDGGWAGYNTIIANYPDKQLSVIILSNTDGFDPDEAAENIAEVFLKVKPKRQAPPVNPMESSPTVKVASEILQKYTGTFKLGPGWYATFTLNSEKLMVEATNEDKYPTEAKADSIFWVPAYNASFTFINTNGEVKAVKYKGINASRITPIKLSLGQLNNYTGVFHSPELETDYELIVVNGKLQVHHLRLGNFALEADLATPDLFSTEMGDIQFVKNKKGKVTGFNISGGRAKNIWFSKR